ncbi:hypothetical protein HC891_05195 [Candidatus Gracilibacteria bacterium]|nr:hypothetical protein [Candidatus Gracilibacteria bacterium]
MQHIQQSPAASPRAQQRTLRAAWLALLGFFVLFLALCVWAAYSGWRYYIGATINQSATLIVRGNPEWISWRPQDRTVFQGVRSEAQQLAVGDAVRIARSADYGQAATIRLFDESTLDLWAGADVTLDTMQTSRWTQSEEVIEVVQSDGYVRYDLRADQPYQQVAYRVRAGAAQITLDPGGSYSVELRPAERRVQLLGAASTSPQIVDIAVRSGSARISGSDGRAVQLVAGQRLEVDPAGLPGLAIPARWELVRDGDFSRFSATEYNNTTRPDLPMLPRSDSWRVTSDGADGVANGYFLLAEICRPPEPSIACAPAEQRNAAWFYRIGNQTASFLTGIEQNLGRDGTGVDISEYRSLEFSVWSQILNQSLDGTGERGTECPVMIRFVGRRSSPADPEHERVVCIYTLYDTARQPVSYPGVQYHRADLGAWYKFTVDLRDEPWFPDYRYLQSIQIYASGHDYDVRVTEVSLIGTQ